MKNKNKKIIASLLVIPALLVSSCTPSSSSSSTSTSQNSGQTSSSSEPSTSVDVTVNSIRIVKDSIADSYITGSNVDLSNLKIETLDSSDHVISTISYSAQDERFVFTTPISTEVPGSYKATLAFTCDDGTFSVDFSYTVSNQSSSIVPTNWEINEDYYKFQASLNLVDPTNSASSKGNLKNTFKKETDFILGNSNGFSLFPKTFGIDPDNLLDTVEITSLTNMSISIKDASNNPVELANVLETESINKAKATGIIDFKDDIEGKYTISFVYGDGTDTSFPAINYSVRVVKGYNITNAKELTAIDNSSIGTNVNREANRSFVSAGKNSSIIDYTEFKKENNIPDACFDSVIIQKDLQIMKADLPTCTIWQENEPSADSVVGSLKDWIFVYGHYLTAEHPTFTIYGNYNKVSTGSDFPNVKTTKYSGEAVSEGTVVSAHTQLFGSQVDSNVSLDLAKTQKFTIDSLSSSGNAGVSTDSVGNASGGILFFKNHSDSYINNCLINSYFTEFINNGTTNNDYQTNLYVNDSRLRDSYSAIIFNWSRAHSYINNSELMNCGGPLVINQGNSKPTTDTEFTRIGCDLTVSKDSFLENYVSGSGGWFDLYGASNYAATIKTLDPLFVLNSRKLTNSDSKLNFLTVSMSQNEGTDQQFGLMGETSIDGIDYINYDGGKTDMDSHFASMMTGDTASQASFIQDLYSTHYGSLFSLTSGSVPAPVFVTYDAKTSKKNFLFTDAKTGIYTAESAVTSQTGSYVAPTADQFSGDYFGLYFTQNGQNLVPGAETYKQFKGSDAFGMVLKFAE